MHRARWLACAPALLALGAIGCSSSSSDAAPTPPVPDERDVFTHGVDG